MLFVTIISYYSFVINVTETMFFDSNADMPTFCLGLTQTPQCQEKATPNHPSCTWSKTKQTLEFARSSEQVEDQNIHEEEVACDPKEERTKSKLLYIISINKWLFYKSVDWDVLIYSLHNFLQINTDVFLMDFLSF